MEKSISEIVTTVINLQIGREATDELSLNAKLAADLHADSLDAAEIIMALEDEYDLEIPDDVALSVETVEDIIDYLEEVL